jgi:hypothetical protein
VHPRDSWVRRMIARRLVSRYSAVLGRYQVNSVRNFGSPNKVSPQNPFDEDTAVKVVPGSNHTLYRGYLTDKYNVGTSPNGGYLMSIVVGAAKAAGEGLFPTKYPDLLSVSAHYVSMSTEKSDVYLETSVLGSNKSSLYMQVSVKQSDQLKSTFLCLLGNRTLLKGLNHFSLRAPELPAISECIDAAQALRDMLGERLNVANEYEFMVEPKSAFAQSTLVDKKIDSAVMSGWLRFPHNRPLCEKGLVFMCDSLPPPAHNIAPFSDSIWVPTIEYTVQIWDSTKGKSQDSTGKDYWYRGLYETLFVANGVVQTDAQIWDQDGKHLLATSRQMARLFLPRK